MPGASGGFSQNRVVRISWSPTRLGVYLTYVMLDRIKLVLVPRATVGGPKRQSYACIKLPVYANAPALPEPLSKISNKRIQYRVTSVSGPHRPGVDSFQLHWSDRVCVV